MNWIPQLSSSSFALAGLIFAAGPVLIHLLNRRRFRLVEWAAMDFVFEALQRQRRRLQLRDLLLLALRTAAVLLFGLALARPFLTGHGSPLDAHSPRHLILLIDNSLSMAYRRVDDTLLMRAKDEARKLIESLPEGSQITVIGTCGRVHDGGGPLRRKTDAFELLDDLQVVDGVSGMEHVIRSARGALSKAAPLTDQVVLFTDLQRNNWPSDSLENLSDQFPLLNIRDMSVPQWENSWVADVRLRDDVVDLDASAIVFVSISHRGFQSRRTQVTLTIDDQVIATRSVELAPGAAERQIAFECSFADTAVEPGAVAFVPLRAAITPDRLDLDDQRTVMVPVVASLPVVFVDQVGESEEDPTMGRLGETRPLRQLLAPHMRQASQRPLVDVRHVTVDQLNREILSTARLVVIAGIPDPKRVVDLLREYVQQGGPVLIAAGAGFDPGAWNLSAWRGGSGLLPGRLIETPSGRTPDEALDTLLEPFSLSWDSVRSEPLLRLPGVSDEQLRELYREPLFFKFLEIETPATADPADGNSELSESPPIAGPPQWLAWKSPVVDTALPLDEPTTGKSSTSEWRVCGRFDNEENSPFLWAGRIGKGQILLATTGLLPQWNNLSQTNAMVLWDYVLRTLIRSTVPERNFTPQQRLAIPLSLRERGAQARLERPGATGQVEVLDVEPLGNDRLGVTIDDAWTRGIYRLHSVARHEEEDTLEVGSWHETIALNGDPDESDLTPLGRDEFQERVIDANVGQFLGDATLSAVDNAARGNALWWWLIFIVFGLLIIELMLLAVPTRSPGVDPARR